MSDIILYKQIYPNQCPTLAKLGIKSLVNLRFDHESDPQPTTKAIEKTACDCGLQYAHLPYSEELSTPTVEAFAHLITNLPKPIMIFCNSGTRAKRIYQSAKILGLIK